MFRITLKALLPALDFGGAVAAILEVVGDLDWQVNSY